MSNFLRHQPCPDCGSKDNCAVYDDGHEWCFGCGYYKGEAGWKKIIRKTEQQPIITLPEDSSYTLPAVARDWYRKYQITDFEASSNKFQWSEEKQWLIMPVWDVLGRLEFFQARCFGTGPKYFTRGSSGLVDHIIGDKSSTTLFAVEDMLSAIKIGRVVTAMPIFGSVISDAKLLRLSKMFDTIVIWLDSDKMRISFQLRLKAKNVFKHAYSCARSQDPKCLQMEDIEYIVKGF